jgi:dihydropteroate synthase
MDGPGSAPRGAAPAWSFGGRRLDLERPCLLGVVNVTPDSFSDGGLFLDPGLACRHAEALVQEGADVLDIGGESTRPGAAPVPQDEELRRILPVIREAARLGVPVSVDTSKAVVAAAALEAGASIVNDVSALGDPAMAGVVREARAGLVLMHRQGTPLTMQDDPRYEDVVGEVAGFLAGRRRLAERSGIEAQAIVLDPGIGFGKRLEDNLALIEGIPRLMALGRPVLVGVSRKRFLGALTGVEPPRARLAGSLAAALAARARGASLFRVHDVAATREALEVFDRLRIPRQRDSG